jgi:hypothetical protein
MELSLNTEKSSSKLMPSKFRCPYCQRVYARESWYRKHQEVCEKKQKFEQTHNMDFIRGHHLYTHWLRKNRWLRRKEEPTATDFINDKLFYNKFMELVKFTTDNWVITGMKYLDYLIDHGVGGPKWCSEETLRAYRDYIRRNDDPINQTRTTVDVIMKWCEKNEVDRREFFAKVGPGIAFQMVVSNQISPWVLFGYDRAISDLLSRVTGDWVCSVNEFLNNTYWINRIKNSPDTKEAIQTECERLLQG